MLSGIRLRYYTESEIKSLAVVRVQNASTYDRGVPKLEGINDPRMGVVDHTVRCPTCYLANCDQHFGYIELAKPVYRVGTVNTVMLVLRCVCRECAKPKFAGSNAGASEPLGLVDTRGLIGTKASKGKLRSISELCRSRMQCEWCGAPQPNFIKRDRTFIDATYRPKDLSGAFAAGRGKTYQDFLKSRFMPEDAAAILHGLSADVAEALGIDRPAALMCRLQLVPPPAIRPSNFVGADGSKVRSENDLTSALQDIVRTNIELQNAMAVGSESVKTVAELHDKLQVMVSGMVNHAIKKTAAQKGMLPLVAAAAKRKVIAIKDRLNGKKARVRGNLNGKRVDQSGRTVISGDASHDIDQLGVPRSMMNKLSFPEPVTNLNRFDMEASVIKGPYVDMGALAVRQPNCGSENIVWLPVLDREARIDLAAQLRPGWIVERHLRNGDWVLFNRQPSLWKASMMAFRCYAVDGLTVRLPLSVTPAFNADFDGDEMNLHALQGYAAIAEAQELMSVPNQMVTPQSNSIIIGLVQDSLTGAYRLSKHDCFLTHAQASTVVCSIHYQAPQDQEGVEHYKSMQEDGPTGRKLESCWSALPQPAVLKGTGPDGRSIGPLWTGKQMVSMLLPYNVNTEKTKTSSATGLDVFTEACVIVRKGHLLTGRLCKATLGKASTGLPHAVWRLYGPWAASKFVSDAQRVFIRWLAYDGPSISIVDCMAGDESAVLAILSRQMGRADSLLKLDLPWAVKEHKSNSMLQETLRSVGSEVLKHVDANSALACNVNSGSKGNVMNIAQIGGLVGQQTVYGKRVPIRNTRIGPRTLACYAPGDLRAEARGFVVNSYLSGLTPAEFFLHQMAGREGIVATAVNTADSGYNQRRMIKGQESQCITYDGTVRVAANAVVQSLYGGDDLDGSRLERVRFPWLLRWRTVLAGLVDVPAVARCANKLIRWAVWRANLFKDLDFAVPCGFNLESHEMTPLEDVEAYLEAVFEGLIVAHARVHAAKRAVLNVSIAAAVLQAAKTAVDTKRGLPLAQLIEAYSKAMAHAGEGVGALGASSIGEPSMQLTLNVFHYSGIASKNVTITGLPRFKQLINAVDSFESANMTAELSTLQHADLAMDCQTVMLSELVEDIHGPETAQLGPFQLAACKAFFAGATGPGPLLQKLKCKEAFSPTAPLLWLRIKLDPTACVRAHVKTLTVANAVRETFGADAMVLHVPYWASDGHTVVVVLHTALTKENGDAIAEALKNQLQVKGLAYVKKALVLQDRVWHADGSPVGRHVLETEGSNLLDLAKSDCVQTRSIVTNNAIEACKVFGITTGLTILQSELHKVLSFDSAYIDPRHTWLLTDTMGRTGSICAMNRHHMQALGSSLLQEASFERSMECFENGATFAISDPLAGATERIIIGQPVAIGTGLVAIVAEKIEMPKAVIVTALPRQKDDPSVRTVVGPLFTKGPKFMAESFAERMTDMSKECTNSVAQQTAATFRLLAASRRICPSISVSKKVSEATFRGLLSTCRDYALWTSTESTTLMTLVEFDIAGKQALTQVPQSGLPSTMDFDVLACFEEGAFKSRIWVQTILQAHAVPISVSPERVTLQQRTTFSKGSWTLTASKEWYGANNVEAERSMLEEAPQCWCCLQASEPETLLQSRCSVEQLANAFVSRLP